MKIAILVLGTLALLSWQRSFGEEDLSMIIPVKCGDEWPSATATSFDEKIDLEKEKKRCQKFANKGIKDFLGEGGYDESGGFRPISNHGKVANDQSCISCHSTIPQLNGKNGGAGAPIAQLAKDVISLEIFQPGYEFKSPDELARVFRITSELTGGKAVDRENGKHLVECIENLSNLSKLKVAFRKTGKTAPSAAEIYDGLLKEFKTGVKPYPGTNEAKQAMLNRIQEQIKEYEEFQDLKGAQGNAKDVYYARREQLAHEISLKCPAVSKSTAWVALGRSEAVPSCPEYAGALKEADGLRLHWHQMTKWVGNSRSQTPEDQKFVAGLKSEAEKNLAGLKEKLELAKTLFRSLENCEIQSTGSGSLNASYQVRGCTKDRPPEYIKYGAVMSQRGEKVCRTQQSGPSRQDGTR